MSVDIDSDELDHDAIYDLTRKIEISLTDEGSIWNKFCNEDLPDGLVE
jgi:hypothetical protein